MMFNELLMILLTHNVLLLYVLTDHIYSIEGARIFPLEIMSVIFEQMNKPEMSFS